jgi:GNAT superfamily N-acetyltransferase
MSHETISPTATALSRGELERHLRRARARRAEATAALLKAAGRSVARALRAAARQEQRARGGASPPARADPPPAGPTARASAVPRRAPAMARSGTIRRLSSERDQIREHLLRLDEDDRRRRFAGYASAARIAAYCAELDMARGLVLGYAVEGRTRGLGELRPLPGHWPRAAEIAISVERPFQGRGIGSALLRRLVTAARNRLYERLYMVCLIDNRRVIRMARRLDGRLSVDQGEVEAWIAPPWPTAWTLLEEAWAETDLLAGRSADRVAPPVAAPRRRLRRPGRAWPACGARRRRGGACAGGSSAA